jgi:glycosyltransferase involved in cell wall biosynthesis
MITVCVPCYNGRRYLRPAIVSILEQTLADFEVIIVDDASTDDTIGLARELAELDDRIHVYSNTTNRNASSCFVNERSSSSPTPGRG